MCRVICIVSTWHYAATRIHPLCSLTYIWLFIRYRQGSRKITAMELANIVSKEEQDAATSVDNTFYDKVSCELIFTYRSELSGELFIL